VKPLRGPARDETTDLFDEAIFHGSAKRPESGDITAKIGLVCARAMQGHEAAAPLASLKKSRRRMPSP